MKHNLKKKIEEIVRYAIFYDIVIYILNSFKIIELLF